MKSLQMQMCSNHLGDNKIWMFIENYWNKFEGIHVGNSLEMNIQSPWLELYTLFTITVYMNEKLIHVKRWRMNIFE
jgi:hypothetical protein